MYCVFSETFLLNAPAILWFSVIFSTFGNCHYIPKTVKPQEYKMTFAMIFFILECFKKYCRLYVQKNPSLVFAKP